MATLFLPKEKFNAWMLKLHDKFTIYYPAQVENKVHYKKVDKNFFADPYFSIDKTLEKIRPTEPLKGFFYRPKEKVGGLDKKSKIEVSLDETPRIIIGAKNCDLRPLMVHQKMYLENEFGEPFYKAQRDRTIIIAADCPVPEQTCFCNLVGLKPYPETRLAEAPAKREGADIVVSIISSGYIFETANEKGESLLRDSNHLFQEAATADLTKRDEQRKQAVATLEDINPAKLRTDLSKAIYEKNEEDFWTESAKSCVECFGCLMVCPTCFCFLLYDDATKESGFNRYKIWDACYYAAYARVGGGMNTRPEFWKRFRNRFHCKFMNFPNDYNFFACSGCGRCYSVCMGKIDIRKILGAL